MIGESEVDQCKSEITTTMNRLSVLYDAIVIEIITKESEDDQDDLTIDSLETKRDLIQRALDELDDAHYELESY
jgi:hypothetical protein